MINSINISQHISTNTTNTTLNKHFVSSFSVLPNKKRKKNKKTKTIYIYLILIIIIIIIIILWEPFMLACCPGGGCVWEPMELVKIFTSAGVGGRLAGVGGRYWWICFSENNDRSRTEKWQYLTWKELCCIMCIMDGGENCII